MNIEQLVRDNKPSASGAERFSNCPGSWNAEQYAREHCEELKISPLAQNGTDIHSALETGDISKLGLTEAQIAQRLKAIDDSARDAWHQEFELNPEETFVGKEERLSIGNDEASAKIDKLY